MFDNRRLAIASYDATGRLVADTFYDGEHDDISGFLELKEAVLARAYPLE